MLTWILFNLLIILTVGLNAVAQLLLKLGATQSLLNIYLLSGILVYGLSTSCYILILGKFNLSIAYPIVIGLTILATTLIGVVFFREKVSSMHWFGIGLMLSGISAIVLTKTEL